MSNGLNNLGRDAFTISVAAASKAAARLPKPCLAYFSCPHTYTLAYTQVTTEQALEALQREANKQVEGGLAAEEAADLQVRLRVAEVVRNVDLLCNDCHPRHHNS